MYTIVTAFFDLSRENWPWYARTIGNYLEYGHRVCSLDDPMVIYTEPKFVGLIEKYREKYKNKTKIIPIHLEQLPAYSCKEQIQQIMSDPQYQTGLLHPEGPEYREPLYDVLMWSKIPFVVKTIEDNPFQTSHFVWLDFGIRVKVLRQQWLNKPLFSHIPDKIKLLCRSYPTSADLEIEKFYKSHLNRLAGTVITGSADSFKRFNAYFTHEVQIALNKGLVDSDQSLFTVIFLKHPELF